MSEELSQPSQKVAASEWADAVIQSILSAEPPTLAVGPNINPFDLQQSFSGSEQIKQSAGDVTNAVANYDQISVDAIQVAIVQAISAHQKDSKFRRNFTDFCAQLDKETISTIGAYEFAEELAQEYGEAVVRVLSRRPQN